MDIVTGIFGMGILGLLGGVIGKLVFALIVWLVGRALIRMAVKLVSENKAMNRMDATVHSFTCSFLRIALYVILIISIIGILGVPMASVVAVLASAGVTVGLAMQGALSNLAGGIMLLLFKPFSVGDYVDAAGVSGTVREVTLFYTVIMSLDNKRITVPNGSLMNANVVNYSTEELRRVDLQFSCAKSENPAHIQSILKEAIAATAKILDAPSAPFARLEGGTDSAMRFVVRVWCRNEDYWDVYYDLTQKVTESFAAQGVQAPASRILTEAK
ncbi:small conductance mechanosensitive channel [Fusobacterium naviforme]|nr:mechanosensitive ion channel [Fusobacterium naviforme]PSL11517.1 small conductance mechanosensitive channel [Fusobacterium naviforme]STO26598.1 Small-conductance mechanosensitive channel [Fusobacterium naviforme]